jgi:hypothetical protein
MGATVVGVVMTGVLIVGMVMPFVIRVVVHRVIVAFVALGGVIVALRALDVFSTHVWILPLAVRPAVVTAPIAPRGTLANMARVAAILLQLVPAERGNGDRCGAWRVAAAEPAVGRVRDKLALQRPLWSFGPQDWASWWDAEHAMALSRAHSHSRGPRRPTEFGRDSP